jgi:hypothetical protein
MADIFKSLHGRLVGLDILGALIMNRREGYQEMVGASVYAQVPSASVLTLFATPVTILPAAPVGFAYAPVRASIHKPAGTAYAAIAAGSDLVFKYTNAAGQQVTSVIEATGFLDQATAQTRFVGMPGSTGATAADMTPVDAAPVVLHLLTQNPTTGTSALHVRLWYDLIRSAFTDQR